MFLWLLLGALPILFFLCIKRSFSSSFGILKKNGIDGPTPSFFYGNFKERIAMGVVKHLGHIHREYGSIVGIYLGQGPQVSITDMELIKLVLIKDFDYFIDRPPFPGNLDNVLLPDGLLSARGETWKSTRRILSPTFSSFKMKAMTPIILNSVKNLVDVFKVRADTDKSFDFFKVYGSFTMESIFAAAFGRVIEIQKGQSDTLTEAGAAIFSDAREYKTTSVVYSMMILSNFPWLAPVLIFLNRWTARERAFKVLHEAVGRLIQERRQEKDSDKYKDLLQLMIDATAEGEDVKNKLTDSQIIGNAITFMLAGYETTANALSYTSYLLALNPRIQEKLQEEIDTYMEENPEVSHYQAAQDLNYLDMVIQESLRLYPPAPLFTRHVSKDYSYKGITIPKDSMVLFPSAALHRDPRFWTDPDTFDPLRFIAEEKAKRPQFCYMPFGHGPRSCIGMRFAMLEAKLALMELLRRFSFVRAPDTQVPLETTFGITMMPKDGIYLKVVTRN